MPDIVLTPILETDDELQLFGPTDPYHYTVDNRPLRRLLINDQRLRDALAVVVDWLNQARDGFETLPERLDNIQAQIDAAAGPAYLIGDNTEPFVFDASNNVLRVKVDDAVDWQVITFPAGSYTAAEVAQMINDQTTGVDASVASGNRVKIASQTVGTTSKIFIDSVANGSTANVVLGFNIAGESSDFSTLESRVSSIEEEIIAARFDMPTLADFLAVSFNPDGTIRDDAIAFTATTVRNLNLAGIARQETFSDGITARACNLYWDDNRGAWAEEAATGATSWYNEPQSTTRGSRREFPTLSYFVLSPNRLDVMDITDTSDPELWMRFNVTALWQNGASYAENDIVAKVDTSGVTFYKASVAHTATSDSEPGVGGDWTSYWVETSEGTALFGTPTVIEIRNGEVLVGTSDVGLFIINFARDTVYWYSTAGKRTYVGAILDRNTSGSYEALLPAFALPSNSVRDVAVTTVDGFPFYGIATANGAVVLTSDDVYTFTRTEGSSSTACAMLGRYFVFSLGPSGSENRVYVIRDITDVNSSGNVDTIADVYYDEHTIPAVDSYPTLSLSLSNTFNGLAIVRGSSHGLKIIYDRGSRNNSWVQVVLATRDTSLLMKGDVRGCWVMDMPVAPDEPVDDLSHNQYALIAKGAPFTPIPSGGYHLFPFDGALQYLINQADSDMFSFPGAFSLTFSFVLDEQRDCALVCKWNENTPAREWKVAYEGGVLKMTLYDENNASYVVRESSYTNFELGKEYFVQVTYDGSGSPGGIHFWVNGALADGSTSVSGAFSQPRATTAALMVGASVLSDGSVGNFFKGKLGLLMICAEEADAAWLEQVKHQVERWRYVSTTRLQGVNRVVSVSCSPIAPVAYVGSTNGVDAGAVCRFSLSSASPLQVWSTAAGTEDDLHNAWASDVIKSVHSEGSLRVYLHSQGSWVELDPVDLRRVCSYLGDFSIDGVSIARTFVSSGGAVGGASRSYTVTVTAANVTNGYIELPYSPSSPSSVLALVSGDGVLINAFSPGIYTDTPDYAVVDNYVIFRNGVTIGNYTSSGLSELLSEGDTVVFFIS